jgi:hypothetical protein
MELFLNRRELFEMGSEIINNSFSTFLNRLTAGTGISRTGPVPSRRGTGMGSHLGGMGWDGMGHGTGLHGMGPSFHGMGWDGMGRGTSLHGMGQDLNGMGRDRDEAKLLT